MLAGEYEKSTVPLEIGCKETSQKTGSIAIELKDGWLRYEKSAPDVLRGASLNVRNGEIFCLLGGNGSGKTTLINALSGAERLYRGKVLIKGRELKKFQSNPENNGRLAMLPQNPQSVFVKDSVIGDFEETCRFMRSTVGRYDVKSDIERIADSLGITHLLKKHPYDLSGGEMQKCAMAKILLYRPEILLLDEPAKGIDVYDKNSLAGIIRKLGEDGLAVLCVTHDAEFAAMTADRCALFFDGEVLTSSEPRKFFSSSRFYTTAVSRIARGTVENAVTDEDIIRFGKKKQG